MIGVILGIIIGILHYIFCKKEYDSKSLAIVESSMVGFSGLMLIEIISMIIIFCTCTSSNIELTSSQKIIALADSTTTSSSYFLGCGSSDSNDYYIYYAEDEHGYKRQKINAGSSNNPVYINYISSNEAPHIDTYQTVFRVKYKPPIWGAITTYFVYMNKDVGDIDSEPTNPGRIEIYIPEGSIQANYNIDLE